MLNFKKFTFEDFGIIKKYLENSDMLSCENSVLNLALWQEAYNNMYAISDGQLILKSGIGDETYFRLPFGDDFELGLKLIKDYCKPELPRFFCIQGEKFDKFAREYSDEYILTESRDDFDYIYSSEDLSSLTGKKYQSKRNHISAFTRKNNWHYESINSNNAQSVKSCAVKWYDENDYLNDKYLVVERQGVLNILSNWNDFDIKGGAIFVDDNVVAFTIGSEISSNTFDVHIEKALRDYSTAYSVINNRFVKNELLDYKYINREDDMGIEGLRKAKLSYKPKILLKKYVCMPDLNMAKDIYLKSFNETESDFNKKLFKTCNKYMQVIRDNDKICSILFLLPVELNNNGVKQKAKYLYAAATDEKIRNKGYMSMLLNNVIKEADCPIFLKPANERLISFYKKFGFKTISATKSKNDNLCLLPCDEFKEMTNDITHSNEEYVLMCYSKDNPNLNGISFPFTME